MNTIKIFLAESGRIADLQKDFPLYQYSYQNKLMNVYVPTSIIAPEYTSTTESGESLTDYVAGTSVKIGMTYVARNGAIKKSKNYYMRYLKTLTYQGIEYALYERKVPKEFTLYAGQGMNAPTVIMNVVNIELDAEPPKVLSVTTTQTCSLDVMESAELDIDEAIEPSELEQIEAILNSIEQTLAEKQDQEDERLNTSNKTVVGAINGLKDTTDTNTTNIETNTQNIAQNTQDIANIKATMSTGEWFVTQMTGSSLPSQRTLTEKVIEVEGRNPKVGDVIIFIRTRQGQNDQIYKCIYTSADGWVKYLIQDVEEASNTEKGVLKGNYGSFDNTQVSVIGGEIKEVYTKDNATGTYRTLNEFINSNKDKINGIEDGSIQVGNAQKATNDENNNNIVDTYMTKNAGASKQDLRNYALPREFNDIYFLTANGYEKTEPETPVTYTATSSQVGYTQLYQAEFNNEADFELSAKNSYQNNVFISVNTPCSVQFRMETEYRKAGGEWTQLNVEVTEPISFEQSTIKKVLFANPMISLNEKVISLTNGDIIRQTLEVFTTTSTMIQFTVLSSSIYPTTFNLNTMAQTLSVVTGVVGEQPRIVAEGTLNGNIISFEIPESISLNDKVEALFVFNYNGELGQNYEINATYGGQNIKLVTPYNIDISGENATVEDFQQLFETWSEEDGFIWRFKGFIGNNGQDIEIMIDMDNLAQTKALINENIQKISDLEDSVVKFVAQTLSEEQKAQARANIGAGTGSDGEVVDIGSYQYSYKGFLVPAIKCSILKDIYPKIKVGGNITLKWIIEGVEVYFKTIYGDDFGNVHTIGILAQNKYHLSYLWRNTTQDDDIVNPVVMDPETVVVDNLESTSTADALSANQGRILNEKIKDIELFKFPNAVIVGEPTISNGQISNFSTENYLMFPFILDVQNRPFQVDFCFTTGNDVTTQQNILDSKFGIALAIANGKGLMAISNNGTSWTSTAVGTLNIQPNTTYYARLSWNRLVYKTQLSTNGTTYVDDMQVTNATRPYPETIFIGGGSVEALGHSSTPFKGTINMNKAFLYVDGQLIWQGMDSAGLETRADVSLSNLDIAGIQKIKDVASVSNPNLLINGDFRVNQRGQSVYDGYNKYTVDRWQIRGGVEATPKSTVTVNSNGTLSLKFYTEFRCINQILEPEDSKALRGKTITFSVKMSNIVGTIYLQLSDGTTTEIQGFTNSGVNHITMNVSNTTTQIRCQIQKRDTTAETSCDVEWTKLEVSSFPTPFSPKPYAEELANCQRYYQKLNGHGITSGTGNTLEAYMGVPLIQSLRTTPTLIIDEYPLLRGNGRRSDVAEIRIADSSYNIVRIIVRPTDSILVTDHIYSLVNGVISFDAEIYI